MPQYIQPQQLDVTQLPLGIGPEMLAPIFARQEQAYAGAIQAMNAVYDRTLQEPAIDVDTQEEMRKAVETQYSEVYDKYRDNIMEAVPEIARTIQRIQSDPYWQVNAAHVAAYQKQQEFIEEHGPDAYIFRPVSPTLKNEDGSLKTMRQITGEKEKKTDSYGAAENIMGNLAADESIMKRVVGEKYITTGGLSPEGLIALARDPLAINAFNEQDPQFARRLAKELGLYPENRSMSQDEAIWAINQARGEGAYENEVSRLLYGAGLKNLKSIYKEDFLPEYVFDAEEGPTWKPTPETLYLIEGPSDIRLGTDYNQMIGRVYGGDAFVKPIPDKEKGAYERRIKYLEEETGAGEAYRSARKMVSNVAPRLIENTLTWLQTGDENYKASVTNQISTRIREKTVIKEGAKAGVDRWHEMSDDERQAVVDETLKELGFEGMLAGELVRATPYAPVSVDYDLTTEAQNVSQLIQDNPVRENVYIADFYFQLKSTGHFPELEDRIGRDVILNSILRNDEEFILLDNPSISSRSRGDNELTEFIEELTDLDESERKDVSIIPLVNKQGEGIAWSIRIRDEEPVVIQYADEDANKNTMQAVHNFLLREAVEAKAGDPARGIAGNIGDAKRLYAAGMKAYTGLFPTTEGTLAQAIDEKGVEFLSPGDFESETITLNINGEKIETKITNGPRGFRLTVNGKTYGGVSLTPLDAYTAFFEELALRGDLPGVNVQAIRAWLGEEQVKQQGREGGNYQGQQRNSWRRGQP